MSRSKRFMLMLELVLPMDADERGRKIIGIITCAGSLTLRAAAGRYCDYARIPHRTHIHADIPFTTENTESGIDGTAA